MGRNRAVPSGPPSRQDHGWSWAGTTIERIGARVRAGDRASMEWHGFGDFTPALLYEVLAFRQAIFVVEQRCAYPDLDGRDERAQHLLLRDGGAIISYARLIPHASEKRVAIGRVAVAREQRRRGLARILM